jgi:hypothetical protein
MIPVGAGKMPECEFMIDVASPSQWKVELRTSDHPENHTPDVLLSEKTIELLAGNAQSVRISFDVQIDQPRYVVVVLTQNEAVSVHTSERRVTGLLSLFSHYDQDRSAYAGQYPTKDIGVESFAFWCPERRPNGRNLAIKLTPPASVFGAMNVVNGISRPTSQPNAWVAAATDLQPILTLNWSEAQTIRRVELDFDTDFDHPMESSLLGHPEDVMPFCVKDYSLWDGADRLLTRIENNHQTRNIIKLASPVTTQSLQLRIHATHGSPAAVFAIRCF